MLALDIARELSYGVSLSQRVVLLLAVLRVACTGWPFSVVKGLDVAQTLYGVSLSLHVVLLLAAIRVLCTGMPAAVVHTLASFAAQVFAAVRSLVGLQSLVFQLVVVMQLLDAV